MLRLVVDGEILDDAPEFKKLVDSPGPTTRQHISEQRRYPTDLSDEEMHHVWPFLLYLPREHCSHRQSEAETQPHSGWLPIIGMQGLQDR